MICLRNVVRCSLALSSNHDIRVEKILRGLTKNKNVDTRKRKSRKYLCLNFFNGNRQCLCDCEPIYTAQRSNTFYFCFHCYSEQNK